MCATGLVLMVGWWIRNLNIVYPTLSIGVSETVCCDYSESCTQSPSADLNFLKAAVSEDWQNTV